MPTVARWSGMGFPMPSTLRLMRHAEKFGFPLVVAVRENTKETILRSGNARLQNAPAAEQATALVEIAKIANLRLLDIVEEPVDRPVA